jgi:hypothetical protein
MAVVGQDRGGLAQACRNRVYTCDEFITVGSALAYTSAYHELAAVGVHDGLSAIPLLESATFVFAHQPAVRVREVLLLFGARSLVGSFDLTPLGASHAFLPRLDLALVLGLFRLRLGFGACFEPLARRLEFRSKRCTPSESLG